MRTRCRRRSLGILALAPLWGGAIGTGLMPLPVHAATVPFQIRRLLMGTWVDITVADGAQPSVAQATEAAWAEMARWAALMSRFDPASEISAINRAAGRHAVAVSPEVMGVLREAQQLSMRTQGAFDATVGRLTQGLGGMAPAQVADSAQRSAAVRHIGAAHLRLNAQRQTAFLDDTETQLDLGGIAKLRILEVGLKVFARHGIAGVMVNGGGDVLASARADGLPWRVGVRDAAEPAKLLAVLPLHHGVVASSGDYERFVVHGGRRHHHIVDPQTGLSTAGVAGVTLMAPQVSQVNGLGAAAMVAGTLRGPALLRHCGVPAALLVASGGPVWASAEMAGQMQSPWDATRRRDVLT